MRNLSTKIIGSNLRMALSQIARDIKSPIIEGKLAQRQDLTPEEVELLRKNLRAVGLKDPRRDFETMFGKAED